MNAGGVRQSFWRRLADLHDTLTSASFMAAAAVLAAIAVSFCYEVAARYLFSAPTSWANAFVSYLLCAAIFLAVPELTRLRAHVAINLLLDRLSPQPAVLLNLLIRAAGAAACLLATWISGNATLDQFNAGIDTISAYPIPKWWVSIFIPYGMLSAGLYFLRDLFGRGAPARDRRARAMTWWVALSSGIGLLLFLLFLGIPVFVAFLILNVTGILMLMGPAGFGLFANSIYTTATTTALATVPLFIVMGEILFRSGAMEAVFDSLDRLVGRIRGRQYVLCILLSAILGALSGAAMAVAGLLGRSLFPEMLRRGYNTRLSAGTILAGASLDPIIPPSVLAILIATLAEISTAALLVAGIIPGLLLMCLFLIYVLYRVWRDPSLAPDAAADAADARPKSGAAVAILRIIPCAFVFFMVMGLIMFGVATPTEAAATGVLGALAVAVVYRKFPGACSSILHHRRNGVGAPPRHHVLRGDVQPAADVHRRHARRRAAGRRARCARRGHAVRDAGAAVRAVHVPRSARAHAGADPDLPAAAQALRLRPDLVLDAVPDRRDRRRAHPAVRLCAVRAQERGTANCQRRRSFAPPGRSSG